MSGRQTLLVSIIALCTLVAGFCIGLACANPVETSPKGDYTDVGGNIDIEYYLEVSEDSIWVEGVQSKKVYSGKYSDLDSLITSNNL